MQKKVSCKYQRYTFTIVYNLVVFYKMLKIYSLKLNTGIMNINLNMQQQTNKGYKEHIVLFIQILCNAFKCMKVLPQCTGQSFHI